MFLQLATETTSKTYSQLDYYYCCYYYCCWWWCRERIKIWI